MFTDDEKAALLEPLKGLEVDPNDLGINMQQVDAGDAGKTTDGDKPDLAAYETEYGKKAVAKAYAKGWRPKEEHKGNPDNWVDPIDFFDRYAETSDKRAEKAAEKRLANIEKTVEKRLGAIAKRVDRIDETDRAATDEYWTDMIANAAPADVPKLMKQRDEAIAALANAGKDVEDGQGPNDVAPETRAFFKEHPYLATPGGPDDVADKAWAAARAGELEAKHPNATMEQIYNQLGAELNAKRGGRTAPTTKKGRNLSDDGSAPLTSISAEPGKMSPADMSGDEKNAFRSLVSLGAYKEADIQKYCDDLAQTKAEAAGQ